MKGLIGKGLLLALALGLTLFSGCKPMHNLVDPCYPERHWATSRDAVNDAFAPQVNNGHLLDQTIWNEAFEPGCETLNALGLQKLAYLVRRRPHADPVIFLQTAQDLPYDPFLPQQLPIARAELDNKRKMAVEQYLMAQSLGRGVTFQVAIHDPGELGLSGVAASQAIQQMQLTRFRGGLTTGGGTTGGSSGSTGTPSGGGGSGGSGR